MYRRTFLKSGIAVAAGVVTTGITPAFAHSISRLGASTGSFSLHVATDDADTSMRLVDRFLRESGLGHFSVRAEIRELPGNQVGDVVFFNGRFLVDYRSDAGELAERLRRLASMQDFPRSLEKPVLLQYTGLAENGSTGDGSTLSFAGTPPSGADLIQDNVLIGRLPLDRDVDAYRIEGVHGHVTVAVNDRSIRIIDASCRHRTCVGMGSVSRPGESLACIPGRVSIILDGESGIDGISM